MEKMSRIEQAQRQQPLFEPEVPQEIIQGTLV